MVMRIGPTRIRTTRTMIGLEPLARDHAGIGPTRIRTCVVTRADRGCLLGCGASAWNNIHVTGVTSAGGLPFLNFVADSPRAGALSVELEDGRRAAQLRVYLSCAVGRAQNTKLKSSVAPTVAPTRIFVHRGGESGVCIPVRLYRSRVERRVCSETVSETSVSVRARRSIDPIVWRSERKK